MREYTTPTTRKRKSRRQMEKGTRRSKSVLSGLLGILTALLVISGILMSDSFLSQAQTEPGAQGKFYKSITIEKGDTLWNIAEKYMTEDYDSIEDYVQTLKKMNNLTTDKILAGDKLIVAYNADF